MTFVEALQKIEADKLKEVKLESYHLPLISQEVYPRFKGYLAGCLQTPVVARETLTSFFA
jgi:hypothetical protein